MWQIANHNYMWMKLIDSRFVSVALVIIISRSGHTRYKNYWSGNGTQDLLITCSIWLLQAGNWEGV